MHKVTPKTPLLAYIFNLWPKSMFLMPLLHLVFSFILLTKKVYFSFPRPIPAPWCPPPGHGQSTWPAFCPSLSHQWVTVGSDLLPHAPGTATLVLPAARRMCWSPCAAFGLSINICLESTTTNSPGGCSPPSPEPQLSSHSSLLPSLTHSLT